jgi:hypothetical protein
VDTIKDLLHQTCCGFSTSATMRGGRRRSRAPLHRRRNWTNDEAVITGPTALQAKAKEWLSGVPGFVFPPAGPVYQTLGLGYLAWNLGLDSPTPVVSGFDVAIIRDTLIAELYTVVTKARQS